LGGVGTDFGEVERRLGLQQSIQALVVVVVFAVNRDRIVVVHFVYPDYLGRRFWFAALATRTSALQRPHRRRQTECATAAVIDRVVAA